MDGSILVFLFFLLYIIIFLVIAAVGIAGTVFWIWMLIDCMTKEPNEGNDKVLWVLIIVLTHLIGAILYYFVRRPQRIKLTGQ